MKKSYIHDDDHGAKRVGHTQVMLDSVLAAFHQGHSAETIAQEYPALTLEEVYGAIADYLANKEEIDGYLRRQDTVWDEWRHKAEQGAGPVVKRLREEARKAETRAK